MQLEKKNIAILATHGFEQSELEVPRERLKARCHCSCHLA